MLKLLVPVGHSPRSLQAVRHATFLYRERCASEIVLINVQAPLESTRLEAYYPLSRLRSIEEKFASDDLAMAERILREAGVQYSVMMKVGGGRYDRVRGSRDGLRDRGRRAARSVACADVSVPPQRDEPAGADFECASDGRAMTG